MATADDATHQMTVTRNGAVEKTFPMSMGMAAGGHQTPNGTYYVLEKFPNIVMDSSTYGVPVNSADGYKVNVEDAVRFDNSGDFVHSAPWSVSDQGKRDVSHGCINISPTTRSGSSTNFGSGDPIVVKNSVGTYSQNDGANDWQYAKPTPDLVPDPHPPLRVQVQLVVLADIERLVEHVDVADDAVAAELRRRVRVDGQPPDRLGVTGFGAPHLRPAEEHPLHAGQPVDHRALPRRCSDSW